ncbi:MAG: TolC family protein [Acidobacteriota bacterium]|nr:TolC family protein [Acidobacteriota bacterium]
MRKALAVFLAAFCLPAFPQQQQQDGINPIRPSAPILWRPYLPVDVPPVRLTNSPRLERLIRGGILYLTAQDAIALALENNIDIETQRYDASGWRLERAEAGGALPGVPTGASQASSVANGQGVLGSQASAGVTVRGAAGGNGSTTNVTVNQVGTVAQTYDPSIQEATTFSHRSLPQPNAVTSVTSVLIQDQRIYTGSYQQGFASGGSVNIGYNDHYLNENAPTDILNPSSSATASITIQHNLLQGFGVAVNTKDIRVAKANVHISDLNFRSQVERTVSSVLGSYYTLAGDYDDLTAKRTALETSERFLSDTKRRVELGAASQLDITTAQNQVAESRQAEVNSSTALQQAEVQLKNLISRTGIGDPAIAAARIVPLDHLPDLRDLNLPSLKDLTAKAIANRSDLLADKANINVSEISSIATINGLLPSAIAIVSKSNQGTSGVPRVVRGETADKYFAGGIGTTLGQVFRNNFPSQQVAAGIQLQAYDRVAQADYAIDQLSLRQQQLAAAKAINQAQVDIANSLVALSQARARYEAAVQNRILQQQLLDAEQKKYAVGESTTYNVIQQQRDLSTAQASELGAKVAWEQAKISLDQNAGMTLEVNRVSIDDAQSGKVARSSELPAKLPDEH